MNESEVVEALAALAQQSRLSLFRLLVKRGPEGYAAGELADRLRIPGPTLSFHLKAMVHAGLVTARKDSRFVYYSASLERMNALMGFLTAKCCSLATDWSPAACAPVTTPRRRASSRRMQVQT